MAYTYRDISDSDLRRGATFASGSGPLNAQGAIHVPDCSVSPTMTPTNTPTATLSRPTETPTATLVSLTPTSTPTVSASPPALSVNIPLVIKNYGSAPNVTPTPTGTLTPCYELILNGGFEYTGDWTFGNTPHMGHYSTDYQ